MTFLLADSGGGGPLIEWIESFGGSAWVLALILVFATLASEDLTCIAGGILAANGVIPFAGASCACALGIWLGDLGLYGLGVLADRSRRNWRCSARRWAAERLLFSVRSACTTALGRSATVSSTRRK